MRHDSDSAPGERAPIAHSPGDANFRRAIEKNADGILVVGGDGIICYANPAAEELLNRPAHDLLGESFGVSIKPGDTTEIDVLRGGLPTRVAEVRMVEIDWEGRAASLATLRDITERKRATEAAEFLAAVGAVLAGTLDFPRSQNQLAHVVTSHLADACLIDLAEADRFIHRVAAAHRDPARDAVIRGLLGHFRFEARAGAGPARVLAEGTFELLAESPVDLPVGLSLGVTCEQKLSALACRSALLVPLRAGGRVFGVVTLLRVAPGRPFGSGDVELAEEFARRTALAIDNARLYSEAREAVRNRDRFLAMLAHELRNPLAPIRNAGHLLRMKPDDGASVREAAEIIDRQASHMSRLVDDLLDVSRVSRNKITLRREALDLKDVVKRSVEIARPLIDAGRHRLTVILPPAPVVLAGDPTRLAQVFGNLLVNAAKYTPDGGDITVRAECHESEAVISVIDSGIGMTSDILSHAFEPFVQADTSADRTGGGLGLGLTLVRSLVELHGGNVEAHSGGPGMGSEFLVRLPLSSAEPSVPATSAHLADRGSTPRRRVLVVDDNVDSAQSLSALLRAQGHAVQTAFDGADALAAAERFRPEIVLLDIGLPGMDGYEVARRLRMQPALAGALLVALTGYGQEEDYRRSEKAGFDRHLVKPVNPEVLQQLLFAPQDHVLPRHRVATPAARHQPGSEASASITILNVDDEESNRLAVSRVLRRAGYTVREAASGHHALALAGENPDLILLDVNLPDIDGIEVCRRLKENPATAAVPVALLSAFFTHSRDRVQGLEGGAEVYLHRPLEPDELLAQIEGILRRRHVVAHRHMSQPEPEKACQGSTGQWIQARALIEVLPVAVVVVEPNTGSVAFANKSARQLAGGCFPGHYVLPPATCAEGAEGEIPTATGPRRVRTFVRPLPIAPEPEPMVSVVLFDVTDLKRAEGELRRVNRAAGHFLQALAQELRNPKGDLSSSMRELPQGKNQPRQVRRVHVRMARRVRQIAKGLEDLLERCRVAQNDVRPKMDRQDLGRLVRSVAREFHRIYARGGITLGLDVPETPIWIMGDGGCLRQVVAILLENSARFTDRGGRVHLGIEAGQGTKEATLTLSDTGIGMAAELRETLTQLFTQGEAIGDWATRGRGLGLAVVRKLVDLHGGKASVASAGPGCGTTFRLSFPRTGEPAALTACPTAPRPLTERLRILIVEDNVDSAETLRVLLQLLGNEVSVAYTGPEGVQRALEFRPDVVLCDIGLPGLDGYGVAQQLRRTAATARARLIAITGYGSEEDRRRCLRVGFNEHLTKPVDPDYLESLLVRTERPSRPRRSQEA